MENPIDPGCRAVVGFGRPHDFEEWPRQTNCYRMNMECNWRYIWGRRDSGESRSPVIGYQYVCRHYLRCNRCWERIPIPTRLCPDWIDRPLRWTPRTDVVTY